MEYNLNWIEQTSPPIGALIGKIDQDAAYRNKYGANKDVVENPKIGNVVYCLQIDW